MKPNTMIRLMLTLVMLVITVFTVPAQLRYGFRFGGDIAAARLKGAETWSLCNRSGFTGGLVLEYQLPNCGFAPDIAVLYGRHNTRLQIAKQPPVSFGCNFIDIPLHLKYKFWLRSFSRLMGPMLYTGPTLSLRLDHNNATPLSTHRLQYGWEAGIGFDIINFIQLSGGYRFALGNSIDSSPLYPAATLHPNGWNISATLLFDF
ncbi:MAG: PorT family protein [Muribaculaceae bacterium]|nr:PorT family protein [Muribaculaceae bacterium]